FYQVVRYHYGQHWVFIGRCAEDEEPDVRLILERLCEGYHCIRIRQAYLPGNEADAMNLFCSSRDFRFELQRLVGSSPFSFLLQCTVFFLQPCKRSDKVLGVIE